MNFQSSRRLSSHAIHMLARELKVCMVEAWDGHPFMAPPQRKKGPLGLAYSIILHENSPIAAWEVSSPSLGKMLR